MTVTNWLPEILYEEGDEGNSNIPFIMVPNDQEMPTFLYVFESRETGEIEPGLDGEDVPVVQWDLHQYADMSVLKEKLDFDVYDEIRIALGLEPILVATRKGQEISSRIRNTVSEAEK